MRPRVTVKQRDILEKLADGWLLRSDGSSACWIESPLDQIDAFEDVPMFTAERLVLRNLVHPAGYLLPDGWRAIGRIDRGPQP